MRALSTGLAIAMTASMAAAQQGDPVVHMSKEPRHKVVFEAGTTRVQDVQIPPGDITLFHTHDHAVLYVPIGSSRTRSQVLGEEWSGGGGGGGARGDTATRANTAARGEAAARGAGSAARSGGATPSGAAAQPGRLSTIITYVEKPVTHRVNNIGDSLFRLIAVGNLGKGSDSDADDVSGLGAKPEVLNKYYRAFRISLPPGESTSAHKHAWPVVVVQQTAGQLAVEGAGKATTTEPGKFAVHDGSGTHQVKNTGTSSVDIIEIELRGASLK